MSEVIPQTILNNLKKYDHHQDDVTCLECGYKGMMGIKDVRKRYLLSFFLAALFVIIMASLGLYGLILSSACFGFLFVVFLNASSRPIYECPKCNQELESK